MVKSFVVPAYLEAKEKDELRRLMFAVQIKLGMKIVFYDFQYVNGKWVCWYEVPFNLEQETENG